MPMAGFPTEPLIQISPPPTSVPSKKGMADMRTGLYSWSWVTQIAHTTAYAEWQIVIISELMVKASTKTTLRSKPTSNRKVAIRPTKKAGRPRAKHSSPDYAQMSIYVHKDVRNKVKVRLFETGGEFRRVSIDLRH